jgi:hypothetical protein
MVLQLVADALAMGLFASRTTQLALLLIVVGAGLAWFTMGRDAGSTGTDARSLGLSRATVLTTPGAAIEATLTIPESIAAAAVSWKVTSGTAVIAQVYGS